MKMLRLVASTNADVTFSRLTQGTASHPLSAAAHGSRDLSASLARHSAEIVRHLNRREVCPRPQSGQHVGSGGRRNCFEAHPCLACAIHRLRAHKKRLLLALAEDVEPRDEFRLLFATHKGQRRNPDEAPRQPICTAQSAPASIARRGAHAQSKRRWYAKMVCPLRDPLNRQQCARAQSRRCGRCGPAWLLSALPASGCSWDAAQQEIVTRIQ